MARDRILDAMVAALNTQRERHGVKPVPLKRAMCAKCGRVFTSAAQYRIRGADSKPICRDTRGCRAREAERAHI